MTIKLLGVDRWKLLQAGSALVLPGGRRWVVIDLNVDMPARFDLVQGGRSTFLTVVQPGAPVTVKFAVEGDCEVVPTTEGEVWWDTEDGDVTSFAVTTASFTNIAQRLDMTPEMEITMLRAKINQEQRLRVQAQLLLEQKQRDDALEAGADLETGVVDENEEPDNADDGAAAAAEAAAAAASSE